MPSPVSIALALLASSLAAATPAPAQSTTLRVEQTTDAGGEHLLELAPTWEGAWRDELNHDALWIIVRASAGASGHRPLRIAESDARHDDASAGPLEAVVSPDAVGVFLRFAAHARGTASGSLSLRLTPDSLAWLETLPDPQLTAHAVEMVYVPAGEFWIGDVSERSLGYSSFFRSDGQGRPAGRFRIDSESPIDIGPGSLLYDPGKGGPAQYRGDARGPIPGPFPKGTEAFYVMKREPTQGLYAEYLNELSPEARRQRRPDVAPGYREGRGTITLNRRNRFEAARPELPLNFTTWDDGMGLLDWLGLRPMTELEFAKACRGSDDTPADDYPWGTASKDTLERVRDDAGDLVEPDRSSAHPADRVPLGASPYGIEDLGGSLWERCVTVGHPLGRAFTGTHGDGEVTPLGLATNQDWPNGSDGGIGYRGGGHYFADHDYGERGFNPHSPVSWRPYASWKDGPPSVAYGQRGVRAAP
ncbi:MAG: formylglycine-generating enzyme family protein [Phycisphaerales bacterium JB040]